MEEIELEPAHHQQSAIIEEYDVDVDVALDECCGLPGIDERAEAEGVGDELPGVTVDVECAEEGTHIGEGGDIGTRTPVVAVHDGYQFLASDAVDDVHDGCHDILEVLAVRHVLVDIEAPAHGAAGEVVYDMLSHELHQFHVCLAAVTHDGDDNIDKEEHEHSQSDDNQDQFQVHLRLTRIESHEQGSEDGDDDGSLHHVHELQGKHEDDGYPQPATTLAHLVEHQDEQWDQ